MYNFSIYNNESFTSHANNPMMIANVVVILNKYPWPVSAMVLFIVIAPEELLDLIPLHEVHLLVASFQVNEYYVYL